MIFESFSQKDTEELGRSFGARGLAGQVYCLVGDLGAGKTAFVRGFARGLGIMEDITSPTFAIVNEYKSRGRLDLYHFDVYRIKHISEMEDTGYEEYFFGFGVTIIEWADLIKPVLPQDAIFVRFERDLEVADDYRRVTIDCAGH